MPNFYSQKLMQHRQNIIKLKQQYHQSPEKNIWQQLQREKFGYFFQAQEINQKVPRSYHKIWWKDSDVNFLEKAKNILSDYTKNNSLFKRFFSLHWNRHHVREVNNIVQNITEGMIVNKNQLIEALDKIHIINPTGSFSTRKAFILALDNIEELDEKFKENRSHFTNNSVHKMSLSKG